MKLIKILVSNQQKPKLNKNGFSELPFRIKIWVTGWCDIIHEAITPALAQFHMCESMLCGPGSQLLGGIQKWYIISTTFSGQQKLRGREAR